MDLEQRIHLLRHVDLFQSFSSEDLCFLVEKIEEVSLEPGEILFYEGDPGNDFYILIEGALRIFKHARTITTLTAVDYVGEMAIIEDKARSATVEALGPCTLLRITASQFQKYFAHQPQSLVVLMRSLSRRVRRDTESLSLEFKKANILIHDMRNLLCAFLYLDILAEESDPEKIEGMLQHMIQARQNMDMMMDEALANAKRLYRPYRMSAGSLGDLLFDLMEGELGIHPDVAGKTISISFSEPIADFYFNALDLRRVVSNLVLNAAQASQPGDLIAIEVHTREGWVELRVRDQGCGIPQGVKDKIFQSHFTTKTSGNGLGLASCRQIVEERHGGTIFFSSTPGRGATFTILLPLLLEVEKALQHCATVHAAGRIHGHVV